MIDELERLKKAATPGPYEVRHTGDWVVFSGQEGVAKTLVPGSRKTLAQEEADACYLAALLNAAPELIRLARRGQLLYEAVFGRCKFCGEEILPTCGCSHD
jgi:hypothetical protein